MNPKSFRMATMALVFLLAHQTLCYQEQADEWYNAGSSTGLDFPRTVYTFKVETAEPACKETCRILLHAVDPASGEDELVRESNPRTTMIFTGLTSGLYSLTANCSHPFKECKAEPTTVRFQAEHEETDIIPVGRMTLVSSESSVSPPRRQGKAGRFLISKWQLLGVVAILAIHWTCLRLSLVPHGAGDRDHLASFEKDGGSLLSESFQFMETVSWFHKFQLHAALVTAQIGFAGFEILTRNVLIGGFSPFVFPVYRNAVALLVLAPLAYLIERKNMPRIELKHLPLFLCTGTIGIFFNQITYILGLRYTSASFTSAYRNSMPIFTFLLAYIIGIEKIDIRRREGQLKLLATALGVSGALVMVLYRGPDLFKAPPVGNHLHGFHLKSWHLGVAILTAAFFSFAVFLNLQAKLMKHYPAPLSIASISILIGCVELFVFAFIVEPHILRWKVNSSTALTVLYAGVIASGMVSAVQSWGVKTGGPVIVAAYQPLETVAVAFLSLVFLKEGLGAGSLFGAFIVVFGLYMLTWAQTKEQSHSSREALLSKEEEHVHSTV